MKIKLVSDSSSNLRRMDGVNFSSVPLKIITDEKEYVDTPELNVTGMVHDLSQYKGKSGSSCPNAHDWQESFEEADTVFGVTISSNLSGSYAAALQAQEDYLEAHPDANVYIHDSLSAGPEMQLALEKLKELVAGGCSFEAVRDRLKEYAKTTHLLFALQSMKNLANNGRISPAAAAISSALGIRVVGRASEEGRLQPLHKCRGEKLMLRTILKEMVERGWKGGKVRIAHCLNSEAAAQLAEMLRKLHPACSLEILPCTALCSFYAEKGGLLIGYEGC